MSHTTVNGFNVRNKTDADVAVETNWKQKVIPDHDHLVKAGHFFSKLIKFQCKKIKLGILFIHKGMWSVARPANDISINLKFK